MKNKFKQGAAALAKATALGGAVAAGMYLCWPRRKVETPFGAQTLDTTKAYNSNCYLSETGYMESMKNIVEPYLADHRTVGYFDGYDGNSLYYEQYLSRQHKAHIVIAHGYTDGSYKFRENIYYFLQAGYSVSIMDQRGHGHSYRQQTQDMSKVTIADFDEYVKDFRIFINFKVKPYLQQGEKLYFYGHSMGGAIGALLLEENPALFDAAVLIAPMMEIEYNGLPENMAMAITRGEQLLGRSEDYIMGCSPFSEEGADYRYSGMDSEARFLYLRDVQLKNKCYQTNGGTYAWLTAAVKACERIRANAGRACAPTLLFQAGRDKTVGPNGQNEYASKAHNIVLIRVPDSKHSIHLSTNDIFIPYMNTVLDFFEKHL